MLQRSEISNPPAHGARLVSLPSSFTCCYVAVLRLPVLRVFYPLSFLHLIYIVLTFSIPATKVLGYHGDLSYTCRTSELFDMVFRHTYIPVSMTLPAFKANFSCTGLFDPKRQDAV